MYLHTYIGARARHDRRNISRATRASTPAPLSSPRDPTFGAPPTRPSTPPVAILPPLLSSPRAHPFRRSSPVVTHTALSARDAGNHGGSWIDHGRCVTRPQAKEANSLSQQIVFAGAKFALFSAPQRELIPSGHEIFKYRYRNRIIKIDNVIFIGGNGYTHQMFVRGIDWLIIRSDCESLIWIFQMRCFA